MAHLLSGPLGDWTILPLVVFPHWARLIIQCLQGETYGSWTQKLINMAVQFQLENRFHLGFHSSLEPLTIQRNWGTLFPKSVVSIPRFDISLHNYSITAKLVSISATHTKNRSKIRHLLIITKQCTIALQLLDEKSFSLYAWCKHNLFNHANISSLHGMQHLETWKHKTYKQHEGHEWISIK